ncbi:hypothetical protein [Pseudorhodobacter aquimaris]|uniref:hypothetical protein n=1 Tax=Pseudorhodobacter aquimaris TaxID=687412 RepID=UPI00067D4B75|nr:hypothetical protein [Pseudorhodobacter aquimaris]
MKNMFRLMALMALCATLVAGSTSMAVARGQAAALSGGGTTIVICSGYGVMTIALDQRGDPLGNIHPCPDCLAGHIACLIPDQIHALHPDPISRRVTTSPFQLRFAPLLRRAPQARGPPVNI